MFSKKKKHELPQSLKVENTPNCAECKYALIVKIPLQYPLIMCNAQAGESALKVYNNELCQKLFNRKEFENAKIDFDKLTLKGNQ
jgi:hypothetical protein